ncbi:MAG TPA: hypothetical protein VFC41_06660 [Anaerovoracaceae bacterium]|nr:hypothetical protein [Anaerovoracaceae bacterium]
MLLLVILIPCIIPNNEIQTDTTCSPLSLCIGLKCPILADCDVVDYAACRFTPNVLEVAAAIVGTVVGTVFILMGCCYYCRSCCFSSKITPIYADCDYRRSKINHSGHNSNDKSSCRNLKYSEGEIHNNSTASISPISAIVGYTANPSAPFSTELGNTIGVRKNQFQQTENHLPSTRVVETREWSH